MGSLATHTHTINGVQFRRMCVRKGVLVGTTHDQWGYSQGNVRHAAVLVGTIHDQWRAIQANVREEGVLTRGRWPSLPFSSESSVTSSEPASNSKGY